MQRFLRISSVALLVGIAFLYPMVAPMPHRINDAHRALIHTGMTRTDVEAIFGVKAGAHDGVHASPLVVQQIVLFNGQKKEMPLQIVGIRNDQWAAWWIGREGVYHVRFDHAERVIEVNSFPRPVAQPPWQRWWSMVRRACGMDD